MNKFTFLIFGCFFLIFFRDSNAQNTAIDTFLYTGTPDTFIVPGCVDSIMFDLRGGKGGDYNTALGGLGGRVEGVIHPNPNDTLYIYVGAAGADSQDSLWGVFNGGGGVYSYSQCGFSGTGGGASDIRLNGDSLTDRIAIAGGGGGGGGHTSQYLNGGDGGGLTGADGTPWSGWPNSGGKGGTQRAGGAAGVACCNCPQHTTAGILGIGGYGSGDCAGGGGGGGGFYGGGGSCFGGAGGGSSYTDNTISSVVHSQGFNNGSGILIITYSMHIPDTTTVSETACDSFYIGGNWQTASGIYLDTLIDGNGCDSILEVNLTINSVDNSVTQAGILLTANETGANYQWLNCDSSYTIISGETAQSFTPSANGSYAVEITKNGCTDTSECVSIVGVGLKNHTVNEEIYIYPSPAKEHLNIALGDNYKNSQIEIHTISGTIVKTLNTRNQSKLLIEIEEFTPGVYFVVVKNKKGIKTLQFLKQ